MARRRRRSDPAKEAFWRAAVERFGRSGLSVRMFCGREGLAEPSFYHWRRELARRSAQVEQGAMVTRSAVTSSVPRTALSGSTNSTRGATVQAGGGSGESDAGPALFVPLRVGRSADELVGSRDVGPGTVGVRDDSRAGTVGAGPSAGSGRTVEVILRGGHVLRLAGDIDLADLVAVLEGRPC